MTRKEAMELCAILARELIDAGAMVELYGGTLRALHLDPPPRNWSDLNDSEQHNLRMAAMERMQSMLRDYGWQMDFTDLLSGNL